MSVADLLGNLLQNGNLLRVSLVLKLEHRSPMIMVADYPRRN